MSEDEFTRLFKYMDDKFNVIENRLGQMATKDELSIYVNAVDAFAKQTEIYMHEMLALGHKVDRHEGWIHKLAKASDIKLSA